MTNEHNLYTMQHRVVAEEVNGQTKFHVELYNGLNTIRISAEKLSKMNGEVLRKQRELGKEPRWYGHQL